MDYKIYNDAYDEIIRPLDLVSLEELQEQEKLFHLLCPVENFEPLRERLDAMVAPSVPTVVSLLVDNSGSMRGYPISFAIGTVGIISMYLDRLGIPNEILGFTTTSWKGGKPYEEFLKAGRPSNPGRLNSLRHVVYKQIDERLEDVRHNLGLMKIERYLKENIDGEAVEWACNRLRSYDTERRILFVISDGAPIDDITVHVNNGDSYQEKSPEEIDKIRWTNYLSMHLFDVIEQLREAGDIRLDAVGIAHDVSRFYGVGDKVDKLEDLAPMAIAKLEAMLH